MEARRIPSQAIEHDDRVVLHRERRRLIGEGWLVEEQCRVIARHMNGVVPGSTAHSDRQMVGRRQDVDIVCTSGSVYLELLDTSIWHDAPSTGDEFLGDDKVVADRRAVDHYGIDAGTAEDVDRRVLQVLVTVTATATEQACEIRNRTRIIRVAVQH